MYIKNIALVFVIIFAFALLKVKAFAPAIIMILIVPFLYTSIKKDKAKKINNESNNTQDKIIYDNEIDEALNVLGIEDEDIDNLTVEDIEKIHKKLIKNFHPDQGGSNYLASKINEAKELLVKYIKNKNNNTEL